jgi:hypothetical protein
LTKNDHASDRRTRDAWEFRTTACPLPKLSGFPVFPEANQCCKRFNYHQSDRCIKSSRCLYSAPASLELTDALGGGLAGEGEMGTAVIVFVFPPPKLPQIYGAPIIPKLACEPRPWDCWL